MSELPPTMWTGAPSLPAFSVDRLARRNNKSSATSASMPSPLPSLHPSSSSALDQYHIQNLAQLLEPAIDGPPSPESIRAFSQQVRQATSSSQQTDCVQQTSSGSTSSLQSFNQPDSPSREHSFDVPSPAATAYLSRKSSGRSTSSNMQQPLRERADSVQIFGKALFNRKTKSKRDSSSQSSSGSSSIYSQDLSFESFNSPPVAMLSMPTANHSIPSLFSRRRTARDSILGDADAKRKYQISAPYNFKHVSHTEKEGQSPQHRVSRMTMRSESSLVRTSQILTNGSLTGIGAEFDSSANSSFEQLEVLDEDMATIIPQSSPVSPTSRVPLIPVRSQDRITRSPGLRRRTSEVMSPVPPPRVSSRVSIRSDAFSAASYHERPQTSGGLSLASSQRSASTDDDEDCLQMRKNYRESQIVPAEFRLSRIVPPASNDTNWPLPCALGGGSFDTLPRVLEEEENAIKAWSRASIISTNSSIRGSKSVPMLWQLANSSQRPQSNASDTLGCFDISQLVAKRSSGVDKLISESSDVLFSDSWEDDIDYCYEHEAEADCNYAWERQSLDLSREDDNATPVELDYSSEHPSLAQGYLSPGHFDMPALSPASHVSRDSMILMEAVTPTTFAAPTTSANFSLPRADIQKQASTRHKQRRSKASNYNEPYPFNLSPTLLIPNGEFQRQISEEPEWYPGQDDILTTRSPYTYEEPMLNMEKSALFIQSRDSASTMASVSSEFTASDRHASTSTTLTRLTNSTSSVNIQGLADKSAETLAAPASPIKTRDDSMTKLTKQRKEPAPTRTRQRAKTLSHAQAIYNQSSMQHYASYATSLSRV